MTACRNGHTKIAEMLLSAGAQINARCDIGATSFIYAAWGEHLEILKLLETRGANIQLRDNIECSALNYGVTAERIEIVEFLLYFRLPVNKLSLIGRTPLIDAIEGSAKSETIKLLLAAGADPNLMDPVIGVTALKAAQDAGKIEIVELLLAAGAIDLG